MREKIYDTKVATPEYTILDPCSIDWSTFAYTNGWYTYYVTQSDTLKPYMISYAFYGDVIYEDIILLLNNIEDPFEMVVGSEIKIPKLDDLKTFILAHRK